MNQSTLKLFSGKGYGKYFHGSFYIATFVEKEAVKMVEEVCNIELHKHEILKKYRRKWPCEFDDLLPEEPVIYFQDSSKKFDPIKVWPTEDSKLKYKEIELPFPRQGVRARILELVKFGKSVEQIVALGFNFNTVKSVYYKEKSNI